MPTRTVAHAVARWTDPDGTPRLATHGQTIDVDDDTAAALDSIGATTPATVDLKSTVAGEETNAGETAPSPAATEAQPEAAPRPRQAAPIAEWTAHAIERGIPADVLDTLTTKGQIIAAVNALDTQETPND
ncbi:hypothetical protein [Prescottella agglutinans]|uniref:hypothetical protein n=1 Tax=Prescottella agglutinans TaxID=1644129 RepID=UPI003D952AB0